MTNERKQTLLKILLPDEDTAKKTLAMTPAEVVAYLADRGETATEDEIKELGADLAELAEKVKAAMDANGGELTEEQLIEVTGGLSTAQKVGLVILGFDMGMAAAGFVCMAYLTIVAFCW